MANTVVSPNMNLPVPVVGTDPGPDWANNINACLSAIDSHNHSSGQGVPISPSGMNINADLSFNGNNATFLRSSRYASQSGVLTGSSDLGCAYVVSGDLYYNDGSGNRIRMTQSGSVAGSSGTITGLPSGTASASYSTGTFTFQAATNTPATMAVGPLVMGASTASPKTVTLSAASATPANYNLQWPAAAPAASQILISDGSGNFSWQNFSIGTMPVGSVIATFPNLTGAYSTVATTAADSAGFVLCQGQTISDGTSPMNGQVVPNINNSIFLLGSTTAGTSGGSATATGVGAHTHTFTSTTQVPPTGHTHGFAHDHKWAHVNNGSNYIYSKTSSDPSSTTMSTSDIEIFDHLNLGTASSTLVMTPVLLTGNDLFTTGAVDGPGSTSGAGVTTGGNSGPNATVSGTTDSTGTSFSIIPPYISAVYLMRIK